MTIGPFESHISPVAAVLGLVTDVIQMRFHRDEVQFGDGFTDHQGRRGSREGHGHASCTEDILRVRLDGLAQRKEEMSERYSKSLI